MHPDASYLGNRLFLSLPPFRRDELMERAKWRVNAHEAGLSAWWRPESSRARSARLLPRMLRLLGRMVALTA